MSDFKLDTTFIDASSLPRLRGRARVGAHTYHDGNPYRPRHAFFIPYAAAAQSDTLRVIFYPPWNISKLPMYMARDAGIFERNGLKITWTNPGSNEKLLAA